jgi:hypothetical protein
MFTRPGSTGNCHSVLCFVFGGLCVNTIFYASKPIEQITKHTVFQMHKVIHQANTTKKIPTTITQKFAFR